MPLFEPMTLENFKPRFEAVEDLSPGIGDLTVGQKSRVIINYEVIEKTKTFTILRVTGLYFINSKRTF